MSIRNRIRFEFIGMGLVLLGFISFPIYPNLISVIVVCIGILFLVHAYDDTAKENDYKAFMAYQIYLEENGVGLCASGDAGNVPYYLIEEAKEWRDNNYKEYERIMEENDL